MVSAAGPTPCSEEDGEDGHVRPGLGRGSTKNGPLDEAAWGPAVTLMRAIKTECWGPDGGQRRSGGQRV